MIAMRCKIVEVGTVQRDGTTSHYAQVLCGKIYERVGLTTEEYVWAAKACAAKTPLVMTISAEVAP